MPPRDDRAGSAEDDALMLRIAKGDGAAARQVVERHLPSLIGLARRMLGSQEEAEDVAQDAFLRLWKQAEAWQPGRALIGTWLRRVVANLCIDRLRRSRTVPLSPEDDRPVAAEQQLRLEEAQLSRRVRQALADLPERQRLALELSHYQGLPQAEAAAILEISEHALESLLARARRSLRASLEAEWKALLPDRVEIEPTTSVKP